MIFDKYFFSLIFFRDFNSNFSIWFDSTKFNELFNKKCLLIFISESSISNLIFCNDLCPNKMSKHNNSDNKLPLDKLIWFHAEQFN